MNLGDLSRHVQDRCFGEWEADMFFWDSLFFWWNGMPSQKPCDSACAISPGGRKERFH